MNSEAEPIVSAGKDSKMTLTKTKQQGGQIMNNEAGPIVSLGRRGGRFAASLAIATALAVGGALAWDGDVVTATYTTGDTTLLDGKVLVKYDGSGKIAKLTMAQGANEKLILTGDELSFAAGAKIVPAGECGPSVIANRFTTEGELMLGSLMTWGQAESYLPTNGTYATLFENTRLDDIVPIESYGNTGSRTPVYGDDEFRYTPDFNFIDRDNGTMRFELRAQSDKGYRAVFVELEQDGDDIKGRVLLSGRTSSFTNPDPNNRFFTYHNGEVAAVTGVDTTNRPWYELQRWLTVGPRYGIRTLTFAMSDDCVLPVVTGGGVDVTFDANASGEAGLAFTSGTLRCNAEWMTLTTEHTLDELTLRTGSIYGSYINDSDPEGSPAIVVGWENNGSAASCQLQQRDGNIVRGVDLEFRQNGDAVEVRWVQALYINDATNADSYYGKQKLTTSTPKINTKANVPDRLTVNWLSTIATPKTVSATGNNTMVGAFTVKGDDAHPIVYDVAEMYAMPTTIDCYGNATLNFSASGATYTNGVSRYTSTITMHSGSRIAASKNYPFHFKSGDVVLDGATLTFAPVESYLNYLTLTNGAAVVCEANSSIRAGYSASDPMWTVTGTGKSTYTGPLHFLAQGTGDNGIEKYLTIAVADTVEGEGTDFLLTGDITADLSRKNASFIKTGAGTMEVDGTIYTTNRAVRVEEGTLLLGRSNATAADVDFSLQGGTLAFAEGTANTVGEVALTADSVISIAPSASLTMADLSIADGKALRIVGAGKARVLSALDTATLSRIRLNGRRVSQGSTGYLYIGGLIIIIR